MGAMLLGGCAAKSTAKSAQAVQEEKDRAACVEQSSAMGINHHFDVGECDLAEIYFQP